MILSRSLPASLGAAALILGLFAFWRAEAQLQTFGKSELTVVGASGRHHFTIEMALTPEQMAQGLMFRRQMAEDAGMLFDYVTPQPASFWMKNTLIPLDMIF